MSVRNLKTQTEAFWRDQYEVSADDLDLVAGQILDAGRPQELSSLVSAIILHRFQHEKEAIVQQAQRGEVYRPADHYQEGQEVVFSALDFESGTVVGVRPGHNPRYGDFEVIQVRMHETDAEREFASRPHRG